MRRAERVRLRGSSMYFQSLVDSRGTHSLLRFGGGVNAGHTTEMKPLNQFCVTRKYMVFSRSTKIHQRTATSFHHTDIDIWTAYQGIKMFHISHEVLHFSYYIER